VAAHLVVAGSLVDDDPVQALAHARAARDRASRIAAVREAVGVAAYHAGDYAEASRELRAYRRMSGEEGYRAVLADCERALGRPEVALRLVREALDHGPDEEETIELRLVEAGARADMGEVPAALLVLETAFGGRPRLDALDLADDDVRRLAAAYADLLSASGNPEAEQWQEAVAAADPEDEDVEFGEEELPLDESPLAPPSEDDEDAEDSEDSDEELVAGDVLPADGEERVDTTVARIPLEDDLLDLPGTSEADIEAEVAELLGETNGDTDGDTGGGAEPLTER
jgi:tetratricopeptide (TPR) repeat protein